MPRSRSRRIASGALVALALAPIASCDPDLGGTVTIYLDTDAPAPGGEALGFPPALFDRVRVEVIPPGADAPCEGCARVVELSHDALARGDVSFGLGLPTGATGARIRATAYRASAFPDGDPGPRAALVVVGEVPALEEGDDLALTLVLPSDETGAPATDLEHPRVLGAGRPDGKRVGSWGPAQRTACTGEAWPGQVCVPGGAFFLPAVFLTEKTVVGYDEQLVVLSPFFVDATETTVRTLFRSGLLQDSSGVLTWSGDEEGAELGAAFDYATVSGNLGRMDLPVTGVSWPFASGYCAALGASLPSEAQVAYLLGGTRGWRFPWGDARPACDDAWLARVGFDFGNDISQTTNLECTGAGFEPFRPVGSSGRDRIALDGGTVEDLAGNAGELSADRFTDRSAPCWGEGVVVDPFCDPADDPESTLRVIRAGSIGSQLDNIARYRAALPTDGIVVDGGFRCVRRGDDVTPPPVFLDVVIGQGCLTDADCGDSPDARCQGPDSHWPGRGVPGGYCSRACNKDLDCGPEGQCLQGWCFLGCDPDTPVQESLNDPIPATKCHGRRDLMCGDLVSSSTIVCSPACNSDADCAGHYCNPHTGGCQDTPRLGKDDGEPCDPDLSTECKGDCAGSEIGNPGGVCASLCSSGGELDSDDCGGAGHGLCKGAYGFESPGSLGLCYPACASHSDCATPSVWCTPIDGIPEVPGLPAWWEVPEAVCLEAYPCINLGQSCPGGTVCTDTPFGPYCIHPSIPF